MPSNEKNFDGIFVEEGGEKELPRSRKLWTRYLVPTAIVLAFALLIVGIAMIVHDVQVLGNRKATGASEKKSTTGSSEKKSDLKVKDGIAFIDPTFIEGCLEAEKDCVDNHAPGDKTKCGQCQYSLFFSHGSCTAEKPCKNLLVYWSPFGCETEGLSDMLLNLARENSRLIVSCMQPHYPGETLPSSLGAPERENLLYGEVFTRLRRGGDIQVWSGERLLHAGCSIGATRYPVVAGRLDVDEQWAASEVTAVCISDGVLDVKAQLAYVREGGARRDCLNRVKRVTSKYDDKKCRGGMDCYTYDSIISNNTFADGISASSFAAKNWKIITEGGSYQSGDERCSKDIVLGDPMHTFCNLINAEDGYSCELKKYPLTPHCKAYKKPDEFKEQCIEWFFGLPGI